MLLKKIILVLEVTVAKQNGMPRDWDWDSELRSNCCDLCKPFDNHLCNGSGIPVALC